MILLSSFKILFSEIKDKVLTFDNPSKSPEE